MPEVFTKAKRSQVISRIRSRGNRDTEQALAALFRRHGKLHAGYLAVTTT